MGTVQKNRTTSPQRHITASPNPEAKLSLSSTYLPSAAAQLRKRARPTNAKISGSKNLRRCKTIMAPARWILMLGIYRLLNVLSFFVPRIGSVRKNNIVRNCNKPFVLPCLAVCEFKLCKKPSSKVVAAIAQFSVTLHAITDLGIVASQKALLEEIGRAHV